MTRNKVVYFGLALVVALLAIPQAGFGGALDLASSSKTYSTNTTWQGGQIGISAAPTLTLNSSAVATLEAGYTALYGTGGRWNLKGNGTLINLGTLNYSNALNVGLSWQSSSATFINEGLFDFIGDSVGGTGGLYWYDAGGKFINTNGGVIQASSGNNHRFSNAGYLASYGGTIRVTNNSSLQFLMNDYYITNATFETYGTGSIRLWRSPTLVHGTAVGKGLSLVSGSFQADAAGTVLDVDGEGVRFGAGYWNSSSATVENRGVFTLVGSGGDQSQIPRGGLLKNTGTFKHFNTSNVGIRPYVSGARFENYGTWICSNSLFYMDQVAGLTFSNMPGSVFQVVGSGESKFFNNNYRFHNEGTVEVLGGYIDFENNGLDTATMSGGVLQLGTWKANGGNIWFTYTSTDITQINTNATVILSGTSKMDELDVNGGSLDTLYGTLGLWAGKQYTNAAALTTDSGTTLEFGLDDSGTDAKLTLQTATALNSIIDVVDLGTMEAGAYTIVEMEAGQSLTEGVDGGVQIGTVTTEQKLGANLTENYGDGGTIILNVYSTETGLQILFL